MTMLLSFYDMYWNDMFVKIEYEDDLTPSAGIWYDTPNGTPWINLENRLIDDATEESETLYRNFIQNNKDHFLHMYLISLGINLNVGHESDNENDFGLYLDESAMILDEYFDSVFGEADYYDQTGCCNLNLPVTIHTIAEYMPGQSRDSVLNAIKNQVNSGNPVIYGGDAIITSNTGKSSTENNYEKTGHCMIAYHETEDGNILLHKSHIGNTSTSTNETDYKYNIDALWIEINEDVLPHVCSEKFDFATSSENFLTCSCKAYKTLHPEHAH